MTHIPRTTYIDSGKNPLLKRRRVLRTAINTHMTSIRAMAVNTDGTNAGAIQGESGFHRQILVL